MDNVSKNQTNVLYNALAEEMENREPSMELRTVIRNGQRKQEMVQAESRRFIAILQNHIFERTQSSVLSIETIGDVCLMRLSCPLQPEEYRKLAGLNYAPLLRSKVHLAVGLCENPSFAWSEIQLSLHSEVIEVLDALRVLQRELERLLTS